MDKNSNIREQRCGLYLIIAYKYKKGLFEVLRSYQENSPYSHSIQVIAGYYSTQVLDKEELRQVLLDRELPPKYISRIVYSIVMFCPEIITRDLVLQVHHKYSDVDAVILLSGMKPSKYPNEITTILFKDFMWTCILEHAFRVAKTHCKSVVYFLEMVHNYLISEQQEQPKSYWELIRAARMLVEQNTALLNIIGRRNVESSKPITQLIRKWFIEPSKKWKCRPWIPDFVLYCPETFRLDI
jgi:hypothetical protein